MSGFNALRTELAQRLSDATGLPVVPHPPLQTATTATLYFRQFESEPVAQGSHTARFILVLARPFTQAAQSFDELGVYVDGSSSVIGALDSLNLTHGSVQCDGSWEMEAVEIGGTMCAAVAWPVEIEW